MNIIKTKHGLKINIRQETPNDYKEVHELVYKAFAINNEFDTADYLTEIRKKDTFIPELSLVAEYTKNKKCMLIGQIVLYKMNIKTHDKIYTELVLSPISVHPDYFRKGVASVMMEEAFKIAINMGYTAVFLCGDINFYSKFGFKPSYEYCIFHEDDKSGNAEWCMALELIPDVLNGKAGKIDIL